MVSTMAYLGLTNAIFSSDGIFEQHESPEAVIRLLKAHDDIGVMLLKVYLLDMISLYASRCGGRWTDSDYELLSFRVRLLGMADKLD